MARVTLQEYCDLARQLIDGHQYADAVAICRHILKRYPRHIRTYQILGEACLESGDLEEAIDIFKRLLENADPENLSAYAGLGVAYQEKGQLTEAIWYMERAFELAPNNEATRNTLRQLYAQRDGKEPDRIRHSKAALARLYARGGQYRQGIEEFRRLLATEESRDRMDLKVSLAETLWRDGRREQATELAREILQAAPDCLKAILLLGEITIEKGRPEEGKAILTQTRWLDPENKVAQTLFGEASPLPPAVVLIPRIELQAGAAGEPPAPAEAELESGTEEVAPAMEEAAEAPEVAQAISEEVEPLATAAEASPETPAGAGEPIPAAMEETAAQEGLVEEAAPVVEEPPALPAPEVAAVTAPEPVAEEAPAMVPEPAAPPVEEQATPAVVEAAPAVVEVAPVEAQAAEAPTEMEPVAEPVPAEAAPKKRGRRAAPQATVLEAAAPATPGPLSDIERYQLLVEQKPKDDEMRLSLARAYRDGSQMKQALEQYGVLVRAKQKLLPEIIADVEGIVASRPDNLEAHELLADFYGKNGQLQKALERYRWVLERLREGN